MLETLVAIAFAAIFIAGGKSVLDTRVREWWAPAAGGVAVAYVFVHLLPELAESQRLFNEAGRRLPFTTVHVYVFALAGFLFFYGMDAWAAADEGADAGSAKGTGKRRGYHIRLVAYAAYAGFVSYLLFRGPGHELRSLLLYAFAMAMHFMGMNHELRESLGDAYVRGGKWVLAGAVLVGWVFGILSPVPRPFMAAALGFLAGAVVINSTVGELPDGSGGRLWRFCLGAVGYALVLLLA